MEEQVNEVPTCFECGAPMKETVGVHQYVESGLSNVFLEGIVTRQCTKCGDREVVIPAMEGLHRVLAMAIAEQHGRLTGEEIRFLRKWLGWSGADFAERFGVQRSTVHRWEHDETQMPSAAEMMLRVIAKHEVPIESYAELVSEPAASHRKMTLRRNLSEWKADGEAA